MNDEASNALAVTNTQKKMDGVSRAAVLLLTLGEDNAAEVLKHMGPKEVQKIGMAMATLGNVGKESVTGVLDGFLEEIEQGTGLGIGSDDYVRNALTQALGEDKAGAVIDRILFGANTKGLDTLKWMDPRAVADVIRYEHPQIQSIVLSYVDPDQAAQVLSILPEKTQADLVMRIAALEAVQPAALKELNDIMERQFSTGATSQSQTIGGVKKIADIMNFLEGSVESRVMEAVKENDEDLGQEIQDLMFVFDNLAEVDDRGIQSILREISTDVLVLAMKGADEKIKEKIFKNMSKRAAELMRDDLDAMGPVKLSDVEGAQKEVLTVARRMAESGEIMLGNSGEEMV